MTFNKPPRYLGYLLRCWQERGQHVNSWAVWRFSLEDPHTGRRRGFANLEALIAFLQAELTDDENKISTESQE
ncbi:MAG: hypothetical protein U0401_25360 [Anaerolineae bacterium]